MDPTYNPGVTTFARGLEKFIGEQKQLNAAGKSADFFAQASPDFLAEIGQTPESWKNLGAKDKVAAHAGFMKALGAQELVEGLKERRQARGEDGAARSAVNTFFGGGGGAGGRPQRSAFASAPRFDTEAQAGGQMSPEAMAELNGEGGGAPSSYHERLRAALATPGLGGRNTVALMRAFQEFQPKSDMAVGEEVRTPSGALVIGTGGSPHVIAPRESEDDLKNEFVEDEETGSRFFTRGKQTMPSGVNPKKLSAQFEQAVDPEGNPTGMLIMRDSKGRPIIKDAPQTGGFRLRPVHDAAGNVIPGVGADSSGKVHDFRDEMTKKLGERPGAPGTKTAPPPAEGNANEVVRVTSGGRKAVFDKSTKQFLRYAD